MITILTWSFLKILISILIREFGKLSISIKYHIGWNLAYGTGLQSTYQDKIDKDKDREKVGNTCIRQSTDKDKGTLCSGKYINVKS